MGFRRPGQDPSARRLRKGRPIIRPGQESLESQRYFFDVPSDSSPTSPGCYEDAPGSSVTLEEIKGAAEQITALGINRLKLHYQHHRDRRAKIEIPVIEDCRYRIRPNSVLYGIIDIEPRSTYSNGFLIRNIPSFHHLVLFPQSKDNPNKIWPYTLVVKGDDKQIKGFGMLPFKIIDLTEFGVCEEVQITAQNESESYKLFLVSTEYRSYSSLAEEIERVNNRPCIDPRTVTLLDPFTGELLKKPARGCMCMHPQCFELETFLSLCNQSNQWLCPICKTPTTIDMLYVCIVTKKAIENLRQGCE